MAHITPEERDLMEQVTKDVFSAQNILDLKAAYARIAKNLDKVDEIIKYTGPQIVAEEIARIYKTEEFIIERQKADLHFL